jgi:hypothetical protein
MILVIEFFQVVIKTNVISVLVLLTSKLQLEFIVNFGWCCMKHFHQFCPKTPNFVKGVTLIWVIQPPS